MPREPVGLTARPDLLSAEGAEAEGARLALLGHDLRAAVSDIVGGLRLIDAARLEEGPRSQFERVRAASEVLARLLEDALAGMVGEEVAGSAPASMALSRLLRDVELRWAGRAREKGLDFALRPAADLPRMIRLDRIALERILSNLLSNAVKYTDRGGIEMAVTLTADATLCFAVRDDGPGFEPPARPGCREGTDRTAKPGCGLGLQIAVEMAARLGGRLIMHNREAGGAEATLCLPQAAWSPEVGAPEVEPGLPDLSQMKVLVAEDSDLNQMLIRQMLTALGAEVALAQDGLEALNRLESGAFDLALIDIEMPRLSGIEVMRAIRAGGGRHARMPILAVTAYTLRANREAILAAGADSILAKPFGGIDTFGAAIAALLERARGPAEAAAPAEAPPQALDVGRFEKLLDIAGPAGRDELLARLLSDLRAVERGLVQGCETPDFAQICAQTHVLIAVSGAVGAERLMQAAQRLNGAAHRHALVAVRELGPEVMALLDDLIHFISGRVPVPLGAQR